MTNMNLLQRSIVLVALTCATATGIVIAKQENVLARPCGTGWLDRLGCTLDPTNPRDNGSITENKFTVYVTNATQKPIIVTARYMNYFESRRGQSCSEVGGGGGDCDPIERWQTSSWEINPGENVLIINDAVGRIIYFSAKDADNRGGFWSEKQVDMGSQYRRFNYTFNP
jgi:hypothetical protein